jgi:hypothetical protein
MESPLMIMGGSSLVAKSPSYFPKIEVLGTLTGNIDYKDDIRKMYPEMADLLIDLSKCESGLDNEKWGDNYKSHGAFQFQEPTFKNHCIREGIGTDWHNFYDQVNCAVDMIKEGIGSTPAGWYNCWRIMNLFKYKY